jgi:hypothetical protein
MRKILEDIEAVLLILMIIAACTGLMWLLELAFK